MFLYYVKLCNLKASFKETQSQCVCSCMCGCAYLDPSIPPSYITKIQLEHKIHTCLIFVYLCMCLTLFFFAVCYCSKYKEFPKRRVNSEFTGLAHNLALLIILPSHDLSEPTEPFLVLCTFCWVLSTWYYKKSILHLSSIILVLSILLLLLCYCW